MKKILLTLMTAGLLVASQVNAMNTVPYACISTGTYVVFSGHALQSELPALESSCSGRFVAGSSIDGGAVPYSCLSTGSYVVFSGQALLSELPALARMCPGRFEAGSLPIGP